MRLTAQEEYGLRCLLQVARGQDTAVTTPEIAEREGLSEAHVHKLMRLLRRAGLVRSVRGRKGGYQPARPGRSTSGRCLPRWGTASTPPISAASTPETSAPACATTTARSARSGLPWTER